MDTTRRVALGILVILPIASPARAQPVEPAGSIRLLSQTPWTTRQNPRLEIAVQIQNEGASTISNPEIGWTIGPKVNSRIQYETALTEGPTIPASADTVPLDDELLPDAARRVRIVIETSDTGAIEQVDSGVYPLQLELRSDGVRIAAVTTAAIHIARQPQEPVLFSSWTEIASPIAFSPEGVMIDERFEDSLEAEEGIVAQVRAISELLADSDRLTSIDVVVSPAALDQLRQAADGYQREGGGRVPEDAPVPGVAAATLARLREIASDPEVRLHAMPFAAPRLPALLSSDLRTHLITQWRLGDDTLEDLLDQRPDPNVARPPAAAFDQATIDALYEQGANTILGAPDSVDRPVQPSGFAPPPVATLSTTSGDRLTIVLPDPGAQALLSEPELRADPVRAAQAVLGELATIWREVPVPGGDEVRGLALELPPDLPAGMWKPLLGRLDGAPFLRAVHAEDLAGDVRPAPQQATLEPEILEGFSTDYTQDLASTWFDVTAFASMLSVPNGEADGLQRAIMYAEAAQYVGSEGSGRMWINAVNGITERTFAGLAPDTSRPLTFTSRSGTIPLRMGDPGGRVLNVHVQLASTRVEFLDGSARTVRLDEPNEVITFGVEVKAAGRSSIEVTVRAPSGLVLSRSVLVVSSTAVNPIALFITVGAGLVLVGLWSRRLFRRRNP
jgi:hypothetical protein